MVMTQSDVVCLLDLADELGLTLFISGGWGVDALVGRQTRDHADLDVSLVMDEAAKLEAALAHRGFELVVDWSPGRRAWRHGDGREIDVHPLERRDNGTHVLATHDGQEFVMPPGSYVTGRIGEREVHCLSVAKQLEFHSGYEASKSDLHDLALLEELTANS